MEFEEYLQSLQKKTVAVIGIGVSNQPLIELLVRHGIRVTACDRKERSALGDWADRLEGMGARLQLGPDYLRDLTEDVIFRTPGMRPDLPELAAAVARGSRLTSEMEAFFEVCPCRKIAVTGSDGKTTTTTIIAELLKRAGKTVHLGGNIGHPLLAETGSMRPEDLAVLELSSSMDIGEHPAGLIGDIYAITNADSVRMYKNDRFVAEFTGSPYENMPHGPILIDDFVGNQLVEDGAVPEYAAPTVKEILLAANRYGLQTLPQEVLEQMQQCEEQFGITETDFMALYGRYIGNWGQKVTRYRFEAIKDGKVVSVITRQPMKQVQLRLNPSHTNLTERHTYDVAAVRIEARSDSGNLLPFYQEPVQLTVTGDIALIGPSLISLKGGMGGTYVKSLGREGQGTLTVSAPGAPDVIIDFQVSLA